VSAARLESISVGLPATARFEPCTIDTWNFLVVSEFSPRLAQASVEFDSLLWGMSDLSSLATIACLQFDQRTPFTQGLNGSNE